MGNSVQMRVFAAQVSVPVQARMGPARLGRILLGLTGVSRCEMRVPGGRYDILCLKILRRLPVMMGSPFKMLHGIAMMLDSRMFA